MGNKGPEYWDSFSRANNWDRGGIVEYDINGNPIYQADIDTAIAQGKAQAAASSSQAYHFGGEEGDEREDFVNRRGCDKGGHRARSLHHQPSHAKHWSKEGHKLDGGEGGGNGQHAGMDYIGYGYYQDADGNVHDGGVAK